MIRSDLDTYLLPDDPGIYIFKKGRTILYVGKATSLRDRVRSYFATDLDASRGERIVGMVAEADNLDSQTTGSVLEALILEANLIKKHQPPYNVDQKDNKSFNYVVITKEDFPRVLPVRGRELFQSWKDSDIKYLFGPFPEGGSLKIALKIIRKIFPYRDRCTPCLRQIQCRGEVRPPRGGLTSPQCKPCFNRQIGLCPGVCSGEMSKSTYADTIRNIKDLFSGNFHGLKRRLSSEMKVAASAERFEEAATLRRQIHALEHVRDVSLIKGDRPVSTGGGVRIEAYDVAHISGSETVAVMVVVSNGEPVKAAYRKFKIRTATNNDVAALKEVLTRRLNHSEWLLPRVFVVDGGKAQLNMARRVLKEAGVEIPIVGVFKDEHHKPRGLNGDQRAIALYERDILLANSEAHRFAISYHRARRDRSFR